MKNEARRDLSAFTLIEVLVVITVLVALAAMLLPYLARARSHSSYQSCIANLKEIGNAYRLWANDNGDTVPAQGLKTNSGWKEWLTNNNQGAIGWTNYLIMSNEMGQSPKLVICPTDERQPAMNFDASFNNSNVSYFIGVGANDVYPQSIASGDRNLGPGPTPQNDYGYSPENGKGNDVTLPLTAPVLWSLKMHSAGKASGAGNILLGDGSGQQTTSASFRQDCLPHALDSGNWPTGRTPVMPSIRLVFP